MSGLVLEGFFLDFCYMVLLTPLVTVLLVVMLTGSSLSYCDARNNLRLACLQQTHCESEIVEDVKFLFCVLFSLLFHSVRYRDRQCS